MQKKKGLVKLIMVATLSIGGVVSPIMPTIGTAHAVYTETRADEVITVGEQYLGVPYKFGSKSTTTQTFDCSSFVQRVYKSLGVDLPRSSRDQANEGITVSKSELKKGDLVFFRSAGTTNTRITHVAIYAGNDKLLHTYGDGGVRYTGFKGTQWEKRYVKSRSVL